MWHLVLYVIYVSHVLLATVNCIVNAACLAHCLTCNLNVVCTCLFLVGWVGGKMKIAYELISQTISCLLLLVIAFKRASLHRPSDPATGHFSKIASPPGNTLSRARTCGTRTVPSRSRPILVRAVTLKRISYNTRNLVCFYALSYPNHLTILCSSPVPQKISMHVILVNNSVSFGHLYPSFIFIIPLYISTL